jgi:hypothetical protein
MMFYSIEFCPLFQEKRGPGGNPSKGVKKLVSIALGPFRMPSKNSRSSLLRQNYHGPQIIYLLIISITYTTLSTERRIEIWKYLC